MNFIPILSAPLVFNVNGQNGTSFGYTSESSDLLHS